MTLFIFRGLPASGKSTKAREMQRAIGGRVVERDELRYMLFGKYFGDGVDEKLVTEVQNMLIDQGLRMGENVFVSDMNLRNSYVVRLIQKAQTFAQGWEIVDLTNVGYRECIVQNTQRISEGQHGVPTEVIVEQYTRYVKGRGYPLPVQFTGAKLDKRKFEAYVRNPYAYPAVIVDIDGTVARMKDRGPFDEHLVARDELIWEVARMVEHAALANMTIIFMSGRTDACYEETRAWLVEHMPWLEGGDVVWSLHMRHSVEDRGRPDDEVKYDLFMKHVAPYLNVMYVIDDRDKVVKMWREIGLVCAQVAYGDF